MTTAVERIILARPRADVTAAERDAIAEAGRIALSAIPGVELVSFGVATAADEPLSWYVRLRFQDEAARNAFDAHPAHLEFAAQLWSPALDEHTARDYGLRY